VGLVDCVSLVRVLIETEWRQLGGFVTVTVTIVGVADFIVRSKKRRRGSSKGSHGV
jgi:hypothetical protein